MVHFQHSEGAQDMFATLLGAQVAVLESLGRKMEQELVASSYFSSCTGESNSQELVLVSG